jgi:predicted  nucleic acid-binding Zn-ribbon protein
MLLLSIEEDAMCPEQTLKRKNIEKITTSSVASDEITAQQKELATAERKLKQVGNSVSKIKDKVELVRQQLSVARNQYRSANTKQTQRAFTTANNRLQKLRQDLDRKLSEYREIKLIARDQRSLVKSLEKKETAKQKAVARFLKEWERDYDQNMRMKRKTVHKRRRAMKT